MKEAPKPQELFSNLLLTVTVTGVLRRYQTELFPQNRTSAASRLPRGCKGRGNVWGLLERSPQTPQELFSNLLLTVTVTGVLRRYQTELFPQNQASAAPRQSRGCKGRSPLHKITKISPFPLGRGVGGWGQESKLKVASAGDKESTPPFGTATAGAVSAVSGLMPGCRGR